GTAITLAAPDRGCGAQLMAWFRGELLVRWSAAALRYARAQVAPRVPGCVRHLVYSRPNLEPAQVHRRSPWWALTEMSSRWLQFLGRCSSRAGKGGSPPTLAAPSRGL